jgi:CDP-glucose 4,6-dehydratase
VGANNEPHEAETLRVAIDKAMWQLNWRPCWSVRDALQRTAQWYRCYFENTASLMELSVEQIDIYQSLLAESSTTKCIAEI